MTRKDFNLIAGVIERSNLDLESKEGLAKDFARELAGTNPNFNPERFVSAATGKI